MDEGEERGKKQLLENICPIDFHPFLFFENKREKDGDMEGECDMIRRSYLFYPWKIAPSVDGESAECEREGVSEHGIFVKKERSTVRYFPKDFQKIRPPGSIASAGSRGAIREEKLLWFIDGFGVKPDQYAHISKRKEKNGRM